MKKIKSLIYACTRTLYSIVWKFRHHVCTIDMCDMEYQSNGMNKYCIKFQCQFNHDSELVSPPDYVQISKFCAGNSTTAVKWSTHTHDSSKVFQTILKDLLGILNGIIKIFGFRNVSNHIGGLLFSRQHSHPQRRNYFA